MALDDIILLLHPALAVVVVFPLIGMVLNRAWLTRTRRLETTAGSKSKIPPAVGSEHLQLGRWLTGMVTGLTLVGLAYPIGSNIINQKLWTTNLFQVIFIVLMFVATIGTLVLLYRARVWYWRAIFATLSSLGVIILGFQDGVYRRDNEWLVSHFYYGITATVLMIFSLAIVQEIYRDRSQTWRRVHIAVNCFATLLFLGQGITGTRDLLEIPLSWQKPHIYRCDFEKQTCPDANSQLPLVSPPLV
ncbi:MAG: DUF4079 domain-containing protein [Thermosynechococcaceae cyanobacterium]